MSANLAAAGIPTRVWDMMPAAVEAAVEKGCIAAEDAAGAVAGADLIVTSLPRSVDVEALADTLIEANALQPDAVWLDCTSGVPDVTQRIYAKLADVDVHFLACGVAGGPAGAEAGTLAAMVGGDAEALATVRCPASATRAQAG